MKSNKLVLTLASIALLASSGNSTTLAYIENFYAAAATAEAASVDTSAVITNMRNGFHIQASVTDGTSYPDDYNYLDSTDTTTANRIYGYIENEDGTLTAACKIFSDDGTETVIYEGDDGGAYYDELTTQNEIVTTQVTYIAMPVQFAVYYRNPFDYIFASDIDDDNYLDTDKASFILSEIVGVDKPVQSAHLIIEDNLITEIEYVFYDQISGYQGTDDVITADISSSASVIFTYDDLDSLTRVTAATNENPELDTAIAEMYSATNYVTYIYSNMLSDTIAMYYADDEIYLHMDAYETGPVEGDAYLVQNTSFTAYYDYYYYEDNAWVDSGYSITPASIYTYYLPDLANASTALFEYDHGTYRLIPEAVTNVAPYMVFYMYSYQLIDYLTGYGGYILLDDEGHISRVESYNVYVYYTFVTTQTFTDWGTAEIPDWFDPFTVYGV